MAQEYVNIDETAVLAPSPAWQEVREARARSEAELRVLHVITGVTMGGAEMMLFRLLARRSRPVLAHGPVAARPGGGRRADQRPGRAAADPGHAPGTAAVAGHAAPDPDRALASAVPAAGLDVPWQPGSKRLALLSGRRLPVIWNVRHSMHDMGHENLLTRGFIRLGAALSSTTRAIIYNARLSASQHEALGYDSDKTVVIPNGFDCQLFRPRPEMAQRLRHQARIQPGRVIVGMVARNHPQKDPGNLIKATALLADRGVNVHVVIVGPGFDTDNAEVMSAIAQAGVAGRFSLLGERHDIPDIVAGLDIATLPSAWGEGFPNVLGEAMACGVPCVTTDIGDSAWIVGGVGIVVPPRDPEALAAGLGRLAALGCDGRRQLGAAARARVLEHFEVDDIVGRYQALYERCSVLERSPARA